MKFPLAALISAAAAVLRQVCGCVRAKHAEEIYRAGARSKRHIASRRTVVASMIQCARMRVYKAVNTTNVHIFEDPIAR